MKAHAMMLYVLICFVLLLSNFDLGHGTSTESTTEAITTNDNTITESLTTSSTSSETSVSSSGSSVHSTSDTSLSSTDTSASPTGTTSGTGATTSSSTTGAHPTANTQSTIAGSSSSGASTSVSSNPPTTSFGDIGASTNPSSSSPGTSGLSSTFRTTPSGDPSSTPSSAVTCYEGVCTGANCLSSVKKDKTCGSIACKLTRETNSTTTIYTMECADAICTLMTSNDNVVENCCTTDYCNNEASLLDQPSGCVLTNTYTLWCLVASCFINMLLYVLI